MSASFALIKFKKTGNIYYGCYEGTSDVILPYICTPEECYDKKLDCYCAITYCRELERHDTDHHWIIFEHPDDLDEVEIYSDYGRGFYWSGTGSEASKMIIRSLAPWDDGTKITDGIPDWAKEFLEAQDE